MAKPGLGDLVRASCGSRSVCGIVVRLERGVFWVETTDEQLLRFALVRDSADARGQETCH